MPPNSKSTKIIALIILSVVFGLLAGIVGELFARAYLLDNALNVPFFGEINLANGEFSGPNVIIRDAKNVIIEQDKQAIETIQLAKNVIVGIFKKVDLPTDNQPPSGDTGDTFINIEKNFYKLEEAVGQGLIITSDGWIVSSFSPKELAPSLSPAEFNNIIAENYVVITHDNHIYPIDNILKDQLTPFSFIHVPARDFGVKRFVGLNEINNGQSVVAVNWEGQGMLLSIYDKVGKNNGLVSFSDEIDTRILLSNFEKELYSGGFIFNLTGDVVGLVDNQDSIYSISNITPVTNSILEYQAIRRARLGIYYVSLSEIVSPQSVNNDNGRLDKGALIYNNNKKAAIEEDSPAAIAGLKAGDIITAIDNHEINQNNELNNIIHENYIAGDEISLVFIRDNQELDIRLVLGGSE
jgi:hypothetical protein